MVVFSKYSLNWKISADFAKYLSRAFVLIHHTECVLIQSTFQPSETFDHRDNIIVQFPNPVSFINFSYPIRHIENVSGNKWVLHLHESQLISVNKNGNSKVTWSAEIKYTGGQSSRDEILDLTTVETCPCF